MRLKTSISKIFLFITLSFFIAQQNYAGNIKTDSVPEFPGAVERQLANIENSIITAAEAMPEDKFDFTPEQLNIAGSNFKGVRTFAGQVKHLATDNYAIWSAITGDPLPAGIKDVNGPADLKTKPDIIEYLKKSFELGH